MAEERGEEVEMRVMSKKEKSKKKKGILHYVCIVLVSVFLTYILVAIGLLFLPQVIPHTKTNFKSYKAFREKAFDFFPDDLPNSADELSYFSYTGNFDECLGVAFSLTPEDYSEMISEFENFYKRMDGDNWNTSYTNMAWKDRILQGKNLQFLESLAGDNLSAYRIIFYMKSAPDDATTSYGVLGNTETGRIVAFYLKDAFPE